MTASHTLIVFDAEGCLVGEWRFKFPYGDAEAAVEPLKKLKTGLFGVTFSTFGVAAHSEDLPKDNPFWRDGAKHVKRLEC